LPNEYEFRDYLVDLGHGLQVEIPPTPFWPIAMPLVFLGILGGLEMVATTI